MNNPTTFFTLLSLLVSCGTKAPTKAFLSYAEETVNVPVPFADGIISTNNSSEFNLCFAPDGKAVYFTRRTGNDKQKIWASTFRNNGWASPERCSFSTDRDEAPFISPDGKRCTSAQRGPLPASRVRETLT